MRWFRLLLSGNRWGFSHYRVYQWERQELPATIQKLWLVRPRGYIDYEIETGYVIIILPRERRTLGGSGLLSGRMHDYLISQRKRVVEKLRSGGKGFRYSYSNLTGKTSTPSTRIVLRREPRDYALRKSQRSFPLKHVQNRRRSGRFISRRGLIEKSLSTGRSRTG